jgi:hypothetical protein
MDLAVKLAKVSRTLWGFIAAAPPAHNAGQLQGFKGLLSIGLPG